MMLMMSSLNCSSSRWWWSWRRTPTLHGREWTLVGCDRKGQRTGWHNFHYHNEKNCHQFHRFRLKLDPRPLDGRVMPPVWEWNTQVSASIVTLSNLPHHFKRKEKEKSACFIIRKVYLRLDRFCKYFLTTPQWEICALFWRKIIWQKKHRRTFFDDSANITILL